MEKPFIYEITVEERLTKRWAAWFEEMTIRNHPDGRTMLHGLIPDQAALFGVLNKIHSLNLTLIAVSRSIPGK